MFIDWVTISVGTLEQETVRTYFFAEMRRIMKVHKDVFTTSYFGTYTVSLPGKFWQANTENTGIGLVKTILSGGSGRHITRFDLAHDFIDYSDEQQLWTVFATNKNITRITSEQGDTWYSGSRESEFFARLYNKSKEIKRRTGIDIDFSMVRFECEIKRKPAQEMFDQYVRNQGIACKYVIDRYGYDGIIPVSECGDTSSLLKDIRKHGEQDAFAFVRRFQKTIRKAQLSDPHLFDELFPHVAIP